MLADDVPPNLSWHQFGTFQIDFATVLLVGAAVLYAVGVWRVNGWSTKRCVAFAAGLVVTFAAVEGFVGVYDDVLFYDHMVQHLLLVMVAAPLFAMGAPIDLLQRATTGRTGELVNRGLRSKLAEVVAHPVVDFLAYAVLIPVCHLTSFYNFTLTHEQAHDGEHLLFLVIGYLFWRHVVAIEPTRHPLHPAVRLLYLALAVPVDTFTGLALASSSHELFPAYADMDRPWGPTRLTDLHVGGVIMWVCGDTLMLLGMVPVAIGWMRHDEREAAEHDRLAADSA